MKTIATKAGSESQILSVGSYRPKRVVLNDEVAIRIDSSDEWIQQRTGIEARRFADESESLLDMATWAAEDALKKAKLSITDEVHSIPMCQETGKLICHIQVILWSTLLL